MKAEELRVLMFMLYRRLEWVKLLFGARLNLGLKILVLLNISMVVICCANDEFVRQ